MSKSIRNALFAVSAIYMLLGLALVIWPMESRKIICYILGGVLLAFGLFRVAGYFFRKDTAQGMRFDVAIGIFNVLIGLFLLCKAETVLAVLGIIVGVAILSDSILKLQMALDIRRMGGARWLALLISALVMLAVGAFLVFNPITGVAAATVATGVSLIIDGAANFWSVMESNRILNA